MQKCECMHLMHFAAPCKQLLLSSAIATIIAIATTIAVKIKRQN